MKTRLMSEFEAKRIAVRKEVHRSREPMTVTLRGKPLVIVRPCAAPPSGKRLGGLKGKTTIQGDLVHSDSREDWDMLA